MVFFSHRFFFFSKGSFFQNDFVEVFFVFDFFGFSLFFKDVFFTLFATEIFVTNGYVFKRISLFNGFCFKSFSYKFFFFFQKGIFHFKIFVFWMVCVFPKGFFFQMVLSQTKASNLLQQCFVFVFSKNKSAVAKKWWFLHKCFGVFFPKKKPLLFESFLNKWFFFQ